MGRRIGLRLAIAAGLVALALPAAAAGTFTPPQGCQGFMTVQLMNCTVGNYYRCSADKPGDSWSTYFDGEGPYFTSHIDAETRWLESNDHMTDEWDYLDAAAPDHASFSTLLDRGEDVFDFSTTSERGVRRSYRGYDRLTGQQVRIDGVPLERSEFDVSAYEPDGALAWHRKGHQLVHRGWRIFLSDTETFENSFGDVVDAASTPIEFAQPGEAGFMATEPQYGCDMMMTARDPEILPAALPRRP